MAARGLNGQNPFDRRAMAFDTLTGAGAGTGALGARLTGPLDLLSRASHEDDCR